jgi:rfaE bifunctional protein kinase chain/domain
MTGNAPPRDATPAPPAREVNAELIALVSRLAGRKVLVIADLIVDEFVTTSEPRVSREAPVLILKYRDRRFIAGGGANAAANVAALGGIPLVLGEVGDDDAGARLVEGLAASGADVSGIRARAGARTPRKTRFLAGDKHVALQQVVRIDRIEPFEHGPAFVEDTCRLARSLVAQADAILVSDYGLGFAEPALVRAVLATGRRPDARVAVDSRHRLFEHVGADVATPSEPEVEAVLGRPLKDAGAVEDGGRQALARLGAQALILTRGSQGMLVIEAGHPTRELAAFGSGTVADVTGAGDTVIATLSLALAAGASWLLAARLANAAAGIAVSKMGTATVSPAELLDALDRLPG